MRLWYMRLGESGKPDDDIREYLADQHDLIMVDYGINFDLSKQSTLESFIQDYKKFDDSFKPDSHLSQLLHFRFRIQKGDFLITPFDWLNYDHVRIAQFTDDFGTLKNILGNQFNTIPQQHQAKASLQEFCLTRRIKWKSGYINKKSQLKEIIFHQLHGSRSTAKKIYFPENWKLPHDLVEDKSFNNWL